MQAVECLCALLVIILHLVTAEHKVIFSEGYSVNERPPTKDGEPVFIESSINLRNILDVAEKEQIISLETTLRLYWKVRYVECEYCICISCSKIFAVCKADQF